MGKKKLVLYGIGQLTLLVHRILESEKKFEITGFTADNEYITGDKFLGLPLIDFDYSADLFPPEEYEMMVLIGYKNMRNRKIMFERAKTRGYKLASYIGPKVLHYDDLIMGENNLIFNGTYLGPYGRIGNNNIIRPNSYLGHNFDIGDHNHISPGCNIGGNSKIRDLCFIGIGATIIDGIFLDDESFITGGTVAIKNTEKYSMYAGNPGKKIRTHERTGIIIER